MTKETRKRIITILAGIAVMLLIAYLPSETAAMTRAAWQYLGCFALLLVLLIFGAVPDWAACLATMAMLAVFKIGKLGEITAAFSQSTLWLCIAVFVMSIGINNSGIMKRIALWVLCKFPGTYKGQVMAMMVSGLVTTPLIPSSYAKTAMMAPLSAQVSEAVGIEPESKQALGLWFAQFMPTYILGIAFLSGSAFVALMMSFMGTSFSWGQWFSFTWLWYIICIILTYVFSAVICKPTTAEKTGNVDFIKDQFKALGPMKLAEKQGFAVVGVALVLWLTQSLHGIDAGMVALLADVAFVACGLITAPDLNAKGQWNLILFIGGVLSIAAFMSTTGVSAWIATLLGPILAPFLSSPYIFVPSLCIITFALRYVIVSQTCLVTIMVGVLAPLLPQYGISIFVLVFVEWMCGMFWNTAYMNPPLVGFVKLAGGKYVTFKMAQKASYYYMVMTIIAMTASIPVWHMLGLC